MGIHTKFWFETGVVTDGYRWMSLRELRVRAMTDRKGKHLPVTGGSEWADVRVLVPNPPPDEGSLAFEARPWEHSTLFLDFVALDPTKPETLLSFANTYGDLEGPSERRAFYCAPKNIAEYHWFEAPGVNPCDGKPCLEMRLATLEDWTRHIVRLRTAVSVFNMHNGRAAPDRKGLTKLFRWKPAETEWDHDWWVIDTRSDQPETKSPPADRIRERVRWSFGPDADVAAVARVWLLTVVNESLDGVASPTLGVDDKDGRITEELVPKTLLALMWCQLFRAISGGKKYEQCRATGCDKWFEISSAKTGNTVRRQYCSDACRVREHRARHQEVAAPQPKKKTKKRS